MTLFKDKHYPNLEAFLDGQCFTRLEAADFYYVSNKIEDFFEAEGFDSEGMDEEELLDLAAKYYKSAIKRGIIS